MSISFSFFSLCDRKLIVTEVKINQKQRMDQGLIKKVIKLSDNEWIMNVATVNNLCSLEDAEFSL